MDTLETRPLGRTALRVSQLGVGTATIGSVANRIPTQTAEEMLHWSVNHGITFIDTAPLYGAGEAERQIGRALEGIPRDRFVLQTKVGRLVQPDGSIVFDFSRDGILRSIEESLARLGMDRVDVLLVHDPYEYYQQALDEAFPTLIELRDQGVIAAVGAGMGQFPMLWDFARHVDVDCFLLAGRYTLLEQSSLQFLEYCHSKQISIVLGGVYNSGVLATGPHPEARYNYKVAPPEVLQKAEQLQTVCRRHNVPLRVAAVHFARAHPAVASLVLGSASAAEAEDNLTIWNAEVPPALWHDVREQGLIDADTPLPTPHR